jgi:hypothetical protein
VEKRRQHREIEVSIVRDRKPVTGSITYNAGLFDGRGRLFRLLYNIAF